MAERSVIFMKILILTSAFPPLNVISSSRPYSWAKYWSRLGHEVTVVTRSKTVKDGPLNFEFNPDDMKDVKIFELKAWPFRIKRPAPEKWVHAKKIPILTNLRRYMEAFWVIRFKDFWGFPVIKKLSRLRKIFPYEIVVSTYRPPGSHIIASYLKKNLTYFG